MAFLKIINYVRLRQKNEMDILMGGAVVDTPSRSYPPLLDNSGGVVAFNLKEKEQLQLPQLYGPKSKELQWIFLLMVAGKFDLSSILI